MRASHLAVDIVIPTITAKETSMTPTHENSQEYARQLDNDVLKLRAMYIAMAQHLGSEYL